MVLVPLNRLSFLFWLTFHNHTILDFYTKWISIMTSINLCPFYSWVSFSPSREISMACTWNRQYGGTASGSWPTRAKHIEKASQGNSSRQCFYNRTSWGSQEASCQQSAWILSWPIWMKEFDCNADGTDKTRQWEEKNNWFLFFTLLQRGA